MRHLAWMLVLLPAVVQAQATAVITGPSQSAPGDLVVLDASASECDALVWSLANSDKTYLPVEGGRLCVFASGQPGDYVFILATAQGGDDGATVALARHTVRIGKPEPKPPGPGPEPEPDPDPKPPAPDLTGLAKEAYDIAMQIDRRSGEVSRLSQSLKTTASRAAGLSWTVPQIASDLRANTAFPEPEQRQRWAAFNAFFGRTMQPITQPSAAIEALNDIASGLDAIASGMRTPSGDVPNDTLKDRIRELDTTVRDLQKKVGP